VTRKTTSRKHELCFDKMQLSPAMLATLQRVDYTRPTPVQAGLIPLIMEGHDVIGQSQTGTGKTAAFAIPIIEQLESSEKRKVPQALVLTPTRELAVQVENEIRKLADDRDIQCCCLYGGRPIRQQINRLQSGCDIVVGTPGRVIDHLQRRTLDVRNLWFVVLDEADRMLDIGFRPDIEKILRQCPESRQTLLLSATLPPPIVQLAKRYMYRPQLVDFSLKQISVETIDQYFVTLPEALKFDFLIRLLKAEQPDQAIIFCRTKLGTERLYRKMLKSREFESIGTIHGDLTQSARDRMMKSFREQKIRFLVATDVVGRGIDVSNISHIINYDIPELSDDYVHRVGRTGRMGKSGAAYTLVTPGQGSELKKVEQKINKPLTKHPMQDWIDEECGREQTTSREKSARKRYRRAL
jgi:ATP-dependent RNA helicase DeaD